MGRLYRYKENDQREIMLYSERGIISFFVFKLFSGDPVILKETVNGSNESIYAICKLDNNSFISVFSELDLGKRDGFGCPDAGLLIKNNHKSSFIFIEAKADSFSHSFKAPEEKNKSKQYNSSINGQIELRWRFIKALRASLENDGNPKQIKENHDKIKEYKKTDVYYCSTHPKKYPRRLNVKEGIEPLINVLKKVDEFYFLVITKEPENLMRPNDRINEIRFLKDEETQIDLIEKEQKINQTHVFWLDYSHIEKLVENGAS